MRLEKELAACFCVPQYIEINAFGDITFTVAQELIEVAGDLTGVARDVAHAFFVAVKFFKRHHGQKDIVLFELEKRHRVVHEHVGVEHKKLFAVRFRTVPFGLLGLFFCNRSSGFSGGFRCFHLWLSNTLFDCLLGSGRLFRFHCFRFGNNFHGGFFRKLTIFQNRTHLSGQGRQWHSGSFKDSEDVLKQPGRGLRL